MSSNEENINLNDELFLKDNGYIITYDAEKMLYVYTTPDGEKHFAENRKQAIMDAYALYDEAQINE